MIFVTYSMQVDVRSERASHSLESISWICHLLVGFRLVVTGICPKILSYKINSARPSVSDSTLCYILFTYAWLL